VEKSYKIISIIMIIIMVSVLVGYREYEVEYGTRHPNPPPPKNFYNTNSWLYHWWFYYCSDIKWFDITEQWL